MTEEKKPRFDSVSPPLSEYAQRDEGMINPPHKGYYFRTQIDGQWQSAEVPFQLDGNNVVLTDKVLAEQPWAFEFIERWKHCFERDDRLMLYRFYRDGVPK